MKKLARFCAGVTVVASAAPSHAQPANPCSFLNGAVTVTITAEVSPQLFVDALGAYSLQWAGGSDACDGATNANTATVGVLGGGANDLFYINQSGPGGPFGPAVVFRVDLGAGSDYAGIVGTPGDDRIGFGISDASGLLAFDRDDNGVPDGDVPNVELVGAFGMGGHDLITGDPPGAFGISPVSVGFYGGTGKDRLIGGRAGDYLDGELDHDVISGLKGADRLFGRGGRDLLYGNAGNDDLLGGAARDRLAGGRGRDLLNGGAGKDVCNGGPALDTPKSCETGG